MENTWKKTTLSDLMNRFNWITLKIGWALLLIPVYRWIYERWTAYESYYSHGPLVLLIGVYFLFSSLKHYWKDPVPPVGCRMTRWTWTLFAIGLGGYLLFCIAKIYFAVGLSVWLIIYSLVQGSVGEEEWRKIRFWFWFIVLSVPVPMVFTEQLALHLKKISTILSAKLLTSIGIYTRAIGNQIYTPFTHLEIGAPCSGLRSILALFTLSVLFSHLGRFSVYRSVILVALSPAVALIGNVLRIFCLGLVADAYGREIALGKFHDILGYLVFGVDLALLWILFKLLSEEK